MRKNDERYPRLERVIAENASQKNAEKNAAIWFQQTFVKLVYRLAMKLRIRWIVDGSQTFGENVSKVVLADVKTNLSEVLQVNILRDITFGNDYQLQEARRLLEKCRGITSLGCELTDFLEKLAHYKGETLTESRKKVSSVARKFSRLFEIREQVLNMAKQVKAYAIQTLDVSSSDEEQDFVLSLLSFYAESLLQRDYEGNEIAADIADQYWDYLPLEFQNYLVVYLQAEITSKDTLPKDVLIEYIPETVKTYEASISRLENSISKALEFGKSAPKVRLSELDARCLVDENKESQHPASNETEDEIEELTPSSNRGYTLEELLGKVTPENSHEATDWGKPVGNEVW